MWWEEILILGILSRFLAFSVVSGLVQRVLWGFPWGLHIALYVSVWLVGREMGSHFLMVSSYMSRRFYSQSRAYLDCDLIFWCSFQFGGVCRLRTQCVSKGRWLMLADLVSRVKWFACKSPKSGVAQCRHQGEHTVVLLPIMDTWNDCLLPVRFEGDDWGCFYANITHLASCHCLHSSLTTRNLQLVCN